MKHLCAFLHLKLEPVTSSQRMVMNYFDLFEVETKAAVVFHIIDMAARWWFEFPHAIVLFVILY